MMQAMRIKKTVFLNWFRYPLGDQTHMNSPKNQTSEKECENLQTASFCHKNTMENY